MIYQFLDLKPRNPYLSLALDEALAFYYGRVNRIGFSGLLRLWSNPQSVIMGRTCDPEKNIHPEILYGCCLESSRFQKKRIQKNSSLLNIPLCRRSSGGGTVLHGPGNINYSLLLPLEMHPELFSVKHSYEIMLQFIKKALEAQGYSVSLNGQSDITLKAEGDRQLKISGNSQFRKYGILTHHGTLITRPHLIDSVDNYLKHPPQEPEYRQGRGHRTFLGSLPDTFDITAFYNCLSLELKTWLEEEISPIPKQEIRKILGIAKHLARNLYSRHDWIFSGRISPTERKELDESLRRFQSPSGFYELTQPR